MVHFPGPGNHGRNSGGHWGGVDDSLCLEDSSAKIAIAQIGGDYCDALLRDPANLGGAPCDTDFGHGFQRDRSRCRRVDDQLANFIDARFLRVNAANQHIDFLVSPGVAGRQVAPDIRNHKIGDVTYSEPESRGAFLIEYDLNLGVTHFDRRSNVRKASGSGHFLNQ
jgi:hypothetical protein